MPEFIIVEPQAQTHRAYPPPPAEGAECIKLTVDG